MQEPSMLVTLSGIVTAGQADAPHERILPMLVTGRPLIVSGMATSPPGRRISDGDRAVVVV